MLRSLFLMVLTLGGGAIAAAQPLEINYQGRLLDADGVPITTSTEVRFEIIRNGTANDAGSGTQVYRETVNITPDATGIFNYAVGQSPDPTFNLSTDIFQTGFPVWLQIRVPGSTGEALLPRTRLVSVPYALVASELDRAPEVVSVPILSGAAVYGITTDSSDDLSNVYGFRFDDAGNLLIADMAFPMAWDGGEPTLEVTAEILGALPVVEAQRDVHLSFRVTGLESGAVLIYDAVHRFTGEAQETFQLPLAMSGGTMVPGESANWTITRRWEMPGDTLPGSILLLAAKLRLNVTR